MELYFISVVTKFDVFLDMYEKGSPQKIVDIVRNLNQKKSEYDKIRKILDSLADMKLIVKNEYGYQAIMNQKNKHLFEMLKYCVKNGVNYNDLFDETVAKYISKALIKKSFTLQDMGLHPRTFSKVSEILGENGFLVVLSRKPFRAFIPDNSFLEDLIIYYGHRPLVAKRGSDEYFSEIEKELTNFKRLSNRNYQKYREILAATQIKFIHHSLSIEGNPITLAQTYKLLHDKIVPENLSAESVQEVQNYQKAFLQMVSNVNNEMPLTNETVLNYHFLAFQHKPEWAGKIRDAPVTIKGNPDYKVADHKDIPKLLDKLLKRYNDFAKPGHTLQEILDFAAYLHNEFQHIHPFFDGNSRTTRMITFHFLQMNGIPILDIPLGMLEEYVFSTKGAKERSDKKLNQALQQIILYNLKTINEKLS